MGLLGGAKMDLLERGKNVQRALNSVLANGTALGVLADGFSGVNGRSNYQSLLADVRSAREYLKTVESSLRTLVVLTQKK